MEMLSFLYGLGAGFVAGLIVSFVCGWLEGK